MLATGRLSRYPVMHPVSPIEGYPLGTPKLLVNDFTPYWGYPKSSITDDDHETFSGCLRAVLEIIGIRSLTTIAD